MVEGWPNVREWSNLLGRRWWEGPEGAEGEHGGAEMVMSLVLHIYPYMYLFAE